MNIKINGHPVEVDDVTSIADVVNKKALASEKIVVEHNYRIVSREDWHKAVLNENDNLEIVSFVGGG